MQWSHQRYSSISYLKKLALEWFEHGVMETDPNHAPTWQSSWDNFVLELHTYFGPVNPTGDAKIELCHLTMPPESQLADYLVQFNTLAAQVTWGDTALHFQFYNGLLD